MLNIDYPAISVEEKTNEQNMQTTKAYLINLVENLQYQIANLESRIERLEARNDNSRNS